MRRALLQHPHQEDPGAVKSTSQKLLETLRSAISSDTPSNLVTFCDRLADQRRAHRARYARSYSDFALSALPLRIVNLSEGRMGASRRPILSFC